ncbi:MAG TPA: carboxypeptidase-like regulatory domain-containing protein, partial [Bryobacteraceae bacterium]|nr:carboxypeptidase-like regulatory domain-containing protein [Bryobacteraceae bacterium]
MLGRMFGVSLLLCFCFAQLGFSQSQNGSISGQVTDNSGALVPQATVTLVSAERNISSVVKSDADGRYSFPNLQPGSYNLTVDAAGFKSYIQRGIQLLASQAVRIDASLQVGDAATKVEVTADVAQLNLDNGGKQEGIAPSVINQLPLLVAAGTPRNAVQFV